MTKDEALKLALEALKQIDEAMPFPVAKLAQASIKEALAQTQEPVAWQFMKGSNFRKRRPDDFADLAPDALPYWKPLYTHPPQRTWVGLFDEEIWQIATGCTIGGDLHADKFARAIESKLKEVNT